MKYNISIIIILALILCCQNSENRHNNISKIENLNDHKEECIETKQIRRILNQLNKSDSLNIAKIDSLIILFKVNEKKTQINSCYNFPYTNIDVSLFYDFVDKLITTASNDWKYISKYVQLVKIIKTNVEWSEVLTEYFHKIALANPKEFLKSYKHSTNEEKKFIVNGLAFLWEYDYLEDFKSKIEQINDSDLQESKKQLIDEINNYMK